jgi:hypothetical protein
MPTSRHTTTDAQPGFDGLAAATKAAALCTGDHSPLPVNWLWPGKIPIGKVTLLVGDPGVGKSLVALDIAARVSREAPWPDTEQGARSEEHGVKFPNSPLLAPSSVLLLSADDELTDTIRPRLDAAGADCDRVFFLPEITDLYHDCDQLEAAVKRMLTCRLIVIDSINAYVGQGDSHFQTLLRRILKPLSRLANDRGIAVLTIAHLRKSGGAAFYRAAGSMGYVASARAVWTICRDDSTPGRHLLLPIKTNLAAAASGMAFTIESRGTFAAPAIVWDPQSLDTPAADFLAASAARRGPEAVELKDAGNWLRRALANGPRPAHELTEAAANFGFEQRTLRRALHAIGGEAQKQGFLEGWCWSLPDLSDKNQRSGICENSDNSSEVSRLQLRTKNASSPNSQSTCEDTREKPVLFGETCPLPEIFDVPPNTAVPFEEISPNCSGGH